jgi:hypothetical protein
MDSDVKALLGRAKAPAPNTAGKDKDSRRENRYIYGGGPARPGSPSAPRQNTKAVRRRISTFNSIVLLFGGGIMIVLYVNNILTINLLAAEVGQLQVRLEAVQNTNASLRADVNKKSAWERIGKTATEQLGLTFPTEQPLMIMIDREALMRAREQIHVYTEGKGTTLRQGDGGSNTAQSAK